jgi:hypothetical protein
MQRSIKNGRDEPLQPVRQLANDLPAPLSPRQPPLIQHRVPRNLAPHDVGRLGWRELIRPLNSSGGNGIMRTTCFPVSERPRYESRHSKDSVHVHFVVVEQRNLFQMRSRDQIEGTCARSSESNDRNFLAAEQLS